MGTDKLQQRIVVHVGFGKTGTTTLQRYVLPKLANEININYNENYAKIKEIMQLSHDRTVEIFGKIYVMRLICFLLNHYMVGIQMIGKDAVPLTSEFLVKTLQ